MGPSPVPIGQLSAQPTGIPQQQNGPRGQYAPVPSNQTLLQPVIPTTTGFNSFVPLRPSATGAFPSFQAQPQQQSFQAQPQQQQPSFLSSQPTGFAGPSQPSFLQSQPTGFSPAPSLFAQNTGFFPQSQSPFGSGTLMSQPTGAQSGSFASPGQYQNNGNFGQVQNSTTLSFISYSVLTQSFRFHWFQSWDTITIQQCSASPSASTKHFCCERVCSNEAKSASQYFTCKYIRPDEIRDVRE